jgi:transcriptional regulator with XRE-family HTH domain
MKKEKLSDAVEILKKRYVKNDPAREASLEEERINSHVAEMIYALRKEKDMTQAELARKINTTQSVISRLEDSDYNGHSLAMLQKICIALGCKINVTIVNDELNHKELEIKHLKQEIQDLKKMMLNETKVIKIKVDEVMEEVIEQRTSSPSDGNVASNYNIIKQKRAYVN